MSADAAAMAGPAAPAAIPVTSAEMKMVLSAARLHEEVDPHPAEAPAAVAAEARATAPLHGQAPPTGTQAPAAMKAEAVLLQEVAALLQDEEDHRPAEALLQEATALLQEVAGLLQEAVTHQGATALPREAATLLQEEVVLHQEAAALLQGVAVLHPGVIVLQEETPAPAPEQTPTGAKAHLQVAAKNPAVHPAEAKAVPAKNSIIPILNIRYENSH